MTLMQSGLPGTMRMMVPADVVAGPAELVALDGRHNKTLNAAHPHPQDQQLHGKGLPRPGGAQEHQVGVLVDLAVEQVHNAQGVVVPVDPQQHPVVVRHLETAEGVGGSRPAGEDVPPGLFLQTRVYGQEGQHRAQGRLLLEVALTHLHIHGFEHVRHLPFPPQQFLIGLGGHSDENTQVEQVLVVVGDAVFDEIPRLDGIGQLLIVGAGVLHPLELGTVEADTLGHLVDGPAAVLPAQVDVDVDALPGVDKGGHPPGPHPTGVAISPDVQDGVIPPIHDDVIVVSEIDAPGRQEFHHRDLRHRVKAHGQSLGCHGVQHHPVHPGLKWFLHTGAAVEDLVEDLRCGLIRIRGLDNAVTALEEVGPGGLLRPLEGAVDLGVVPIGPAHRLEDEEEPAGEDLPAAHILDEPQVVLPQSPALEIVLPG